MSNGIQVENWAEKPTELKSLRQIQLLSFRSKSEMKMKISAVFPLKLKNYSHMESCVELSVAFSFFPESASCDCGLGTVKYAMIYEINLLIQLASVV